MVLFDPIRLGNLELPNRIVKAALGENMADASGRPTPALIALYERWAAGGAGLLLTGITHIRQGFGLVDGELGAYDDELIPALSALPEAVHRHGGRVFMQLNHAPPQVMRDKARRLGCQSASAGLNRTNLVWNQALPATDVAALAADFGAAARRAREAGFDGVEIQAAHGYMLSRFISPKHNRRADAWGGNFERRVAILDLVMREVSSRAGADFPVMVKLNAHDGIANGLRLEEAIRIGQRLEALGAAAIEVSAGNAEVRIGFYPTRGSIPLDLSCQFLASEFPFLRPVMRGVRPIIRHLAKSIALTDEAYFATEARRFAASLSIPVVCVGGIRSREVAEQLLTSDIVMVSLGRPLLCQPELPNAWKQGEQTTAACTSCNRCFVNVGLGEPLRCWTIA